MYEDDPYKPPGVVGTVAGVVFAAVIGVFTAGERATEIWRNRQPWPSHKERRPRHNHSRMAYGLSTVGMSAEEMARSAHPKWMHCPHPRCRATLEAFHAGEVDLQGNPKHVEMIGTGVWP